jgi:broad specificity phosphatase PhoE
MALKQVLLFRHAEKPADSEDPTLTPQGTERAKRLAQMLPARYGAIDAVYAAAASACRDRSGRLRCGPQSGRD